VAADRTLRCWGLNGSGQFGNEGTNSSTSPYPAAEELTFEHVSAGKDHVCGLRAGGLLYCWGSNSRGQLGVGTTGDSRLVPALVAGTLSFQDVSAGYYHTCAVATGGDLYCWGDNNDHQIGDGTDVDRLVPTLVSGGLTWVSVSAGEEHTCGMTSGSVAYCWGLNRWGQLGNGEKDYKTAPVAVPD
jgi:alpha-tubulin suppressor-like RCC1 family protein